ncbi:hypothetical protein [Suipraeoptans intestinalis]|uniref:hypothetical protein n=1 Tax=Suipraeoptans intestinalis TaxID=2606628 RepID=UPI0023F0DAD1|nr:hypothetical protein [Suipraeoptans intestinalis]MDD7769514.1 hypothetical protein [Suipraeoptans intestinalis]MDY3121805.1 hypothetical protein [Suipraeoptans intestinalis]
MKLVEKVKILHKTYSVEEVKNLRDEGGDLYGEIYYLLEKIYLNSDAEEEKC